MVILKALEKRPENRWQTATAMAEALRAAYDGVEPNVVLSHEQLEVPMLPLPNGGTSALAVAADVDRTPAPRRLPPARQLPQRPSPIPRRALGLVALVVLALGGLGLYNLMPKGGPGA